MHVKTTLPLAGLFAIHACAPAAHAQWARGAGPDAATPPVGSVRISATATWTRSIDAWIEGTLKPLGSPFSVDSLGSSQIRSLTSPETSIQQASGLSGFRAILGASQVQVRRSIETTPLTAEYAVTRNVFIAATIPFVTSIARIDAVMASATANTGINPALNLPAVAATNGTLVTQIDAAAAFVSTRIATCAANPAASACAGFNGPTAQALVTEAAAYSGAMSTLFGGKNGSLGQPFVPTAGSAALQAIAARLADLKTRFSAFGANHVTSAAPGGAAPITTTQLQSILTDSLFGIRARPLGSVVRRGMGDIEIAGQVTWHDSYARASKSGSWRERLWWRSAIHGTQRLGTGDGAAFADLVPVPIGTGLSATIVRLITDIGSGTRWSVSTAQGFATRATANSDEEVSFTLAPRWAPSEAISVAGVYEFRSVSGERTEIEPGITRAFDLREPVSGTEQRVGMSLAYSTLSAWQRGAARLPLEISYVHYQTTGGAGEFIPKLSHDALVMRWYWLARR